MSKEHLREYVTQAMVDQMDSDSENMFAQRILDKIDQGAQLELLTQVSTGGHVIDFLVRNLKRGGSEKFVEVTLFTKSQLKNYHPPKKDHHPRPEDKSLFRKHGQLNAMRQSGSPWTILTKETLDKLKAINEKHPDYKKRQWDRKAARTKRFT